MKYCQAGHQPQKSKRWAFVIKVQFKDRSSSKFKSKLLKVNNTVHDIFRSRLLNKFFSCVFTWKVEASQAKLAYAGHATHFLTSYLSDIMFHLQVKIQTVRLAIFGCNWFNVCQSFFKFQAFEHHYLTWLLLAILWQGNSGSRGVCCRITCFHTAAVHLHYPKQISWVSQHIE